MRKRYTLKLVVDSMLRHARPEDIPEFLSILLDHYVLPEHTTQDNAFTLLDAIRYLPTRYYDDEMRDQLIEFAAYSLCINAYNADSFGPRINAANRVNACIYFVK